MQEWISIYETCEYDIEAPDIHMFPQVDGLLMGPLGFWALQDLYNPTYGPFSGTAIGYPVLAEPTVQIFGTGFWLGKSENLD